MGRGALPITKLAVPLAAEQFLRILVSLIDTFMLSTYSVEAVAASGIVGQYIFFLTILFNIVAVGASIVLAQYLGAERSREELGAIVKASVVMIIALAVVLTLAVFFGTMPLLNCYSLEERVRQFAWEYFVIFGGVGAVFNAFSLLQSAVLRCYGYTREAMYATLISNLVNVVGNALSLYGWFGLPVLGVRGVAWASTISIVVSCLYLGAVIQRKSEVEFNFRGITKIPRKFFRLILSVGIPSAGENLSYNVSQITITAMISTLGTYAMSAQVYTNTIARFVFVIAVGIGAAVQIKSGYYVGAQQGDIAYVKIQKYSLVATAFSVGLCILLNLVKYPVIGIFTKEDEIVQIVSALLMISVYLEFGRSLNLVYVGALKGAGDIRFPVFYGIFSNWCIMVLGAYIFGIRLGFGIKGCYLAIATDETTRGMVMFLRWRSKRWMTKSLV